MKVLRHAIVWGLSFFLFFTFSIVSQANPATSQAGISFTEKEEVKEEGDSTFQKKDLPNTTGNRTNWKLPQTGEDKNSHIFIVGMVILLVATLVMNKGGERRMNLKMLTVAGLIGSGMLIGTGSVVAAPQDTVTGSPDGKGGTSHGYINLIVGDDTTETEVVEKTDPTGETHNKGVLTLDNIAPLLFSTQTLNGKKQVYTSTVANSNIQVTDKRGEEAGWNVQVSQTPFKDIVDETKELKGATIVLPVGTVKAEDNTSTAPKSHSVEINASTSVLLNAAAGGGAGTWRTVFNKDEVKLTVPPGNKKGEYMSTVTWALIDAPTGL